MYLNLVKYEILKNSYVAIEVDETTDCVTLTWLVFVILCKLSRKVLAGKRFKSFIEPKVHGVKDVSEAISIGLLDKINVNETPEKLIAQSHDSFLVMSGTN